MLLFIVSFLSLLLLLPLKLLLLPSWSGEMRLLFLLLCRESFFHSLQCLNKYNMLLRLPFTMFTTTNNNNKKSAQTTVIEESAVVAEEEVEQMTAAVLLDLPELALELVLEKLSPAGLLNMSSVCSSLRERCTSDHLWKRHFSEKWGGIIGEAARREWESSRNKKKKKKKDHKGDGAFVVVRGSRNKNKMMMNKDQSWWLLESLSSCVWPWPLLQSKEEEEEEEEEEEGCSIEIQKSHHLPVGSIMARYLALETGSFCFPAQVYNREQNEHVGFMLSCYDAKLCYDSRTDTFRARYPPHGQKGINVEEEVQWERLRVSPVDTSAHDLHISDCLHELRPGDHIEIQWRRNKEFPYGWWYGVVGHLESCDGAEHHCRCYNSDTVILEFNQYSVGSRWRRTAVDRKDHREEGNELDGFYGGIRKLYSKCEISMWKQLWPTEVLG